MPCGKEKVFKCKPGEEAERAKQDEIIQNVLNDELFGFFEVDIEVPEQKRKRFSEFCPLFVISEVPEDQIPQHMKDYKINTGRKMIKNNKKLLGVMKAEKILLYSPLLKWYLNQGLQVTKIHRYISYTSGRPFKWFPEEVSSARRDTDQDKNKGEAGEARKQLGDTAKLKGNSFYGKMIENLEKHISTKFTTDEKLIDKIFRSPFFEDLEEINAGVFEVRQRKRQVTITRPYQCGIAVYQLAKLRMLEFYYDFLDKFCDRRDFELIQMDTDSFYMALSAEDFDEIIKPEMKELYKEEKKNWLVTDEYSKRVPGLFKAEFQGKRMIALTSKCYFVDSGGEGVKKFSCKGVSRRILFEDKMRDGKNDLTDSEAKLPPQVRSFFWFHVYFTVRRILFELGGPQNSLPLPGDTAFSQTENKYDIPSFERICAEFGISPNADFRFTRGDNHGLGSVFEYFTNSGYTKTPFKYPSKETKFEDEGGRASDGNLVPYIENTEARNQYEYFLCPVSHGLTSAGLSRINQSIESFCYAILGSQVDVCSSITGSQRFGH